MSSLLDVPLGCSVLAIKRDIEDRYSLMAMSIWFGSYFLNCERNTGFSEKLPSQFKLAIACSLYPCRIWKKRYSLVYHNIVQNLLEKMHVAFGIYFNPLPHRICRTERNTNFSIMISVLSGNAKLYSDGIFFLVLVFYVSVLHTSKVKTMFVWSYFLKNCCLWSWKRWIYTFPTKTNEILFSYEILWKIQIHTF